MNLKLTKGVMAAIIAVITGIVYYMTAQPSVSFWDCGECTAAAAYLQVAHPPGAPFFSLVGRFFAMLPIVENVGLRTNILSVFNSMISVAFLFLIMIKLIENYRTNVYSSLGEAMVTYLSAAAGALAFSFSHSFWFNGTETEIYATNTTVFAAIIYFGMLWNEKADNPDNLKYIFIIAYLMGISSTLRMYGILAIIPIIMIIMVRKYVDNEEEYKKSTLIFLGHALLLIIIAFVMWASETGTSAPSPEEYKAFDTKFLVTLLLVSAVIVGIFWKKLLNRNSIYIAIIIGVFVKYLIYPGVVKMVPQLLDTLAGNSTTAAMILVLALLGILSYIVYYAAKNKKTYLYIAAMSIILIFVGYTSYAMIIVRSNQDPPMNENSPKTFSSFISYLNREQYGDWPQFKRRFSAEPHQQGIYTNYSSDLDFFWNYQMNHMMTRYVLWQYGGRESWDQDSGVNFGFLNKVFNGIGKPFNIHFGGDNSNSFFGIPFLIGLIGIFFHFRRDWKMATAYMLLFVFCSYLFAFYQNQQEPQPRERDKFLASIGFVYAIWIAIGIYELAEFARKRLNKKSMARGISFAVIAICFVVVPFRMLQANYYEHDRSKDWVPWDFSYNLLQSCAPNAVLFTNGDNDTFPLWYLQDVEGIRRDVKIVCLSLLNTNWYIRQMKNNDPYNVGKVKLSISDEEIDQLNTTRWDPQQITLAPPDPETVRKSGFQPDSAIMRTGLTFTMNNTLTFGDVKAIRVQDFMVRQIVLDNNWERPIYFAITCSQDSKIGLDNFLKMEGMAQRLVPEKRTANSFINEEILNKQIHNADTGFDKNYRPGFSFRGLNDPHVFFDDNHLRMMMNYRNVFITLAVNYLNTGNKNSALKTLDLMENKMPRKIITMEPALEYELGNLYFNAGGEQQGKVIFVDVEKKAQKMILDNPESINSQYNPYTILLGIYEKTNEHGKMLDLWRKIQVYYPNDPSVKANIEKYTRLRNGLPAPVDTGRQ